MTMITNPTGRNTQAYIVTLDDSTRLFFSYETLIAVETESFTGRVPNRWGPTTGRHFRELGCYDFPVFERLPVLQCVASGITLCERVEK